jgi:CubicO group peptidase (beta-lactamase class C family)
MSKRFALCAAAVFTLAACSSNSSSSDTTAQPTTGSTSPTSAAPATTEPAPETTAAATTTAGAAANPAAIEQTRALMSAVKADQPGCTIAVAKDGKLAFAEAYGASKLEPLTPMSTDTVVDIGSTSKQFTATAILLLADRGQVDLTAPVSTYLPDLPAWADQVTVTQMVHHQSGIPDYIFLLTEQGKAFTEVTTDADALAALGAANDLEFAPGSQFSYSNSNYFLLGQIVLAVTGDDLGAFLASEVFTPLQLDAVMDPTAQIPEKATSYAAQGDGWVVADSPWEQLGDGGIQTTPTQLVKWASEYWAPTIGPADINTQRFAEAVDAPNWPGRYGFGIAESDLDGQPVINHAGGWGGFVTTFVVDPAQKIAIAGTCTSAPTWTDPAQPDLGQTLMGYWRS